MHRPADKKIRKNFFLPRHASARPAGFKKRQIIIKEVAHKTTDMHNAALYNHVVSLTGQGCPN